MDVGVFLLFVLRYCVVFIFRLVVTLRSCIVLFLLWKVVALQWCVSLLMGCVAFGRLTLLLPLLPVLLGCNPCLTPGFVLLVLVLLLSVSLVLLVVLYVA